MTRRDGDGHDGRGRSGRGRGPRTPAPAPPPPPQKPPGKCANCGGPTASSLTELCRHCRKTG